MKIKEIKYVSADTLQQLQDLVQIALDQGWAIHGNMTFGHGTFIQEMGLPYAVKDFRTIVCGEEEYNPIVNAMLKEGYVLHGYAFPLGGKLCQTLLRFE